jgi:hypothetical protein
MRRILLVVSLLSLSACATSTRYELASSQLGGTQAVTGYAPYTPERLSTLRLEKQSEDMLAGPMDPIARHDCAKLLPAERIKWPACLGKLW